MKHERKSQISSFWNLGKPLLLAGALLLILQASAVAHQVVAIWQHAGSEIYGWLPALGMTAHELFENTFWNHSWPLAAMARLLILCWPLLLLAVGIVLHQKKQALLATNAITTFDAGMIERDGTR